MGPQGPAGTVTLNDLPITVVEIADFSADNAPIINAVLADADTCIAMLPAGVIQINSSVIIPTGKQLIGAGVGKTTLKAKSTFSRHVATNAMIATYTGTKHFRVADLSIDASKVGIGLEAAERINGFRLMASTDFVIERIRAKDHTGYSFIPQGNHGTQRTERGVLRDLYSENANVHFETMYASDILWENLIKADGDGDIGCEAVLHCVEACDRITYRSAYGTGSGFGVSLVTTVHVMQDITFDACHLTTTDNGSINAGGGASIKRVNLSNSFFESTIQTCANLVFVSDLHAANCTFRGNSTTGGVGSIVLAASPRAHFVNCYARGHTSGSGAGAFGIASDTPCHFDGELVAEITAPGASATAVGSSTVRLSPTTKLTPDLANASSARSDVRNDFQGTVTIDTNTSGVDSYATIILPDYCYVPAKAHVDYMIAVEPATYPTAHATFYTTCNAGSYFINVRILGDHGGKTLRWHFREMF